MGIVASQIVLGFSGYSTRVGPYGQTDKMSRAGRSVMRRRNVLKAAPLDVANDFMAVLSCGGARGKAQHVVSVEAEKLGAAAKKSAPIHQSACPAEDD